jgi:hypothetical protein
VAISPMLLEAAQWAADSFAAGAPGNRNVRDAFVAWWACEDGYDWPTNSRNNPGNLRPAGDDTGSVGVTASNFYIYATPGDGVAMHVQRVKRSNHYAGIRTAIAAVAAGRSGPTAIANAVGASPWGTNAPCMRGAIASVARQTKGKPTPRGTGWATVHRLGPGAGGGSGVPAGIPASTGGAMTTLAAYANVSPSRNDNLWDVVKSLVTPSGRFTRDETANGVSGAALVADAAAFVNYLVNKGQLLEQVAGLPSLPIDTTPNAGEIQIPVDAHGRPDMARIRGDAASSVNLPSTDTLGAGLAVAGQAIGSAIGQAGFTVVVMGGIVGLLVLGAYLTVKPASVTIVRRGAPA